MKFVAYYRVSTQKQGASGLGLDAQRKAVADYLATTDSPQLIHEFTEVESGTKADRPVLLEAFTFAELTGATLVVAKLDRLSRNAAFLNTVFDSKQKVVFADMPFADRFMIGVMAQVAQWEAERISKRTKEALTAAKDRGAKLGGKRRSNPVASAVGRERSKQSRQARAADRNAKVLPYIAAARESGCTTLRSIAGYLNGREIKTARGCVWEASSVARVLDRASIAR